MYCEHRKPHTWAPTVAGHIVVLSLLCVLTGCTDPYSGNYMCSGPTCPTPTPFVPTLQGRVTDAHTAAPVIGATVDLQGKQATTSSTGDFVIQELNVGTALLTI